MRCLLLILLLISTGLNLAAEREPNGKLYNDIVQGIKPWFDPYDIKSVNYPSPAPHDLEQTWRFVASWQDNKPKALKLMCSDVSIPKEGSSCGDFVLKLQDGTVTQELCGELKPFTLISITTDVRLKLFTGKREGGRVSCKIQAIYVDERRNEITTTTTAPPPSLDMYKYIPSEEVDSSEHGGEPGDKFTTCACGWANKVTSRIVNGTVTARNEFPFAAALIERESKSRFCGATIITEYHVITAAHCTEGSVRSNVALAVIVGMHGLKEEIKPPAQIIDVERILQHQGYGDFTPYMKHDLTLLVLSRKITFGPKVGPACLPTHQVKLDRQYVKILGWGSLYSRGPESEYLRKVDVRVLPMDECNYEYTSVDNKKPTQFCTYSKHGASCQGDSGGPVIWLDPETNRYTLVGAVSYGSSCGERPTVHTAIGNYLDWIQHYVKVSKGSNVCKKIN